MDLNEFFKRLDLLFAQKEPEKAERYMKESLEEAESSGDLGAVTAICSELGGFYRLLSRCEEGVVLYEKALACIHQIGLDGSEHHGTTLMNYAATCTVMGEKEKALSLYERAAEMFQNAGLEADYRQAALCNNVSRIYEEQGHFDLAEKHLRRALAILEQIRGSGNEQAVTYANLANIYLASDRLKEARSAAERSVELFCGEGGEEDVHYAAAVCTMGDILFREKAYDQALDHFEKAMALTQRDFGNCNLSYSVLCGNAAKCCEALNRREDAMSYGERARVIRERIAL